ncbi:MAG: hypothetical protein K2Q25_00940 [Mycobacteriaceae bacterium]|nr:hypothetical protein [Mycobacteriaceae bacterium]
MNYPRRPDTWGHAYPPVDPAYADQPPYPSTYGFYPPPPPSPSAPMEWNSTQQLPQYWPPGTPPPPPPGNGPAPTSEPEFPAPQGPQSPRWLWFVAVAAVLLVVGMVIALVIANGVVKQPTAVSPLPVMTTPKSATRPPVYPPATTSTTPPPTDSDTPTQTSSETAMQAVVYTVSGDGRAISITYRDTGNVMETEFNVLLPWTKQVSLQPSANHRAIVTIINIGHDVTCSVTVAGVQVRQRTGAGLTMCDATS